MRKTALQLGLEEEAARCAALPPLEQHRELLRLAWLDYHKHREEGPASAVSNDQRQIRMLSSQLAEMEAAETREVEDPLEGMTVQELVQEQCEAIEDPDFPPHLLEPLVAALARRLGVRAIQRLVTPGLRVVEG